MDNIVRFRVPVWFHQSLRDAFALPSQISYVVRYGTALHSIVWNSLPDCLRDPAVDSEQFRRDLKMYMFAGHLRR